MSRKVASPGRPKAGEEREVLQSVTFRADAETLAALDVLEADLMGSIIKTGRRSIAIRGALLLAANAVRGKSNGRTK